MNRDSEYLQNFDSDCVGHDFDEYDPLGTRIDDEERTHDLDDIILNYNNNNNNN